MDDSELSNTVMDDGGADNAFKKRPRKKHLYSQILNQMEFYFSDANLAKDRYLSQILNISKNVPLDIFLRFNRVRALTTDIKDVAKALGKSEILKVTEDGQHVYRTTEIRKKENTNDCVIYVEQLPPDANHEWVSGIFSAYGKVEYVSIPKYKSKATNKGFAFVEFNTPEAAQKALEAFGSVGSCLSPEMSPEELCSVTAGKLERQGLTHYEIENGKCQEPRAKKIKLEEKQKRKERGESTSKVFGDTHESEDMADIELLTMKKSKKRKFLDEDVEAEHLDEEMDADCDAQMKRKKKNVDEKIENIAAAENDLEEHRQNNSEKRKKKQQEQIEEGDSKTESDELELDRSKESGDLEHMKKKKKKKKGEANSDCEGSDNDEGTTKREKTDDDQEIEAEECLGAIGDVSSKKRTRKRNKNKMKKESDPTFGLQILSKREWARLRNKYLALQREKMSYVKNYLARTKYGSNYQSPYPSQEFNRPHVNPSQEFNRPHVNPSQEVNRPHVKRFQKHTNDDKPKTKFQQGVIIKIDLPEPLQDTVSFKKDAKLRPDVVYVDVNEGESEGFIRCASAEAAQKLVTEQVWENMNILEGAAENTYWEKVWKDREDKVKNKIKVNVRGKDKLLKRAERELGKHIRFDD